MAFSTFVLNVRERDFGSTKPTFVHVKVYPLATASGALLKVVKDTTGNVVLSGHADVKADASQITAGLVAITLPDPRDTTLNPTGFGLRVDVQTNYFSRSVIFGPTEITAHISGGVLELEDVTDVAPTAFAIVASDYARKAAAETIGGLWNFTTAPTLNGSPFGSGGGGSTTDASLLTSGILPAARIADASVADAKLASGTSLTAAERTKLTGIATGATANSADATLLNRANHTGTQAESTVTNLVTDLAARAQMPTRTALKTANYTAALWDLVPCDTSGGAFTVTLPAASGGKGRIALKLVTAGNTLSLALTGSDHFNTTTGATTGTLSLTSQGIIVESDGTSVWTVTADDLPLSGLDLRYDATGAAAAAQAFAVQRANHTGTQAVTTLAATGTPSSTTYLRGDGSWSTPAGGGGGSVATDALFDAKGDLAVGTADNTAARLPVGADGSELVADSTQTSGVKWVPRTRVADESHADTTIVNTITETTAASLTLPTSLATGDVVRFMVWADQLNNSGASVTYRYRLKLGSTTVLDTNVVTITTSTSRTKVAITVDLLVESTTAQRVRGQLIYGRAADSWGINAPTATLLSPSGYGTATEDLTVAKTVLLTVQMGTAASTADFVAHAAALEIIKKA